MTARGVEVEKSGPRDDLALCIVSELTDKVRADENGLQMEGVGNKHPALFSVAFAHAVDHLLLIR